MGTVAAIVLNNSNNCVCVCGDFNYVRSFDKRKGRVRFSEFKMSFFNKFIVDSILIELSI